MASNKSVKRQRQKEMRRAKIEQEMKQRQAARRRQRVILLLVVALVAVGVAFANFKGRSDKARALKSRSPAAGDCRHNKPPGGNTDTPSSPPPMTIDRSRTYTAVFRTSCGTIEAELAAQTSPNAVNSFVFLAKQGFYNGLSFHRIVKGFAIQGGDPKGDGTGGPNYKTVDPPPPGFKYPKGTIAMAKGGAEPAGTAGSQFFFVPADGAALDPLYAVLGKVVKGEDVLEKLNRVRTKAGPSGEKSTPVEPVYIEKVTIRESGGH